MSRVTETFFKDDLKSFFKCECMAIQLDFEHYSLFLPFVY